MNINVYAENSKVWGDWLQTGRVARKFDFPLAADGSFEGKVNLGASVMTVTGKIAGDTARIDLHGYCKFGGVLTKKS